VSGDELTQARTAFQSAQAARALARAGVESAEATQAAATGELQASAAMVEGTNIGTAPEVLAARARLAQARLNLQRTVIRAPIDGIVTSRQVQIGQRVAAGAPIMTLVPVAAAYVDANFKEDQLAKVRPGQPVRLTSDFYGGDVVFHGRVVGFAGGTGAAFALIPAQNATGNWIKVVQRLPVRIALDPRELTQHPLRVGLSMTATVDTRGH
jgi:membrane fusion protein (multidrug efflux system)